MIYFIQSGENGPIKIGFTSRNEGAHGRAKEMQVGNPERLIVLAQITGERDDEKSLHRLLKDYRIWGEWYSPSPEVLKIAAASGYTAPPQKIRDIKRKTLELPVDIIEWITKRAKENKRTFTGQLIVDLEAYRTREDRIAGDMASIQLQTR